MIAPSVVHAFEYLIGLAVFGLLYWLLNGILVEFKFISVTGYVYQFANYVWAAIIVIYLIFGMIYLWSRLKEWMVLR